MDTAMKFSDRLEGSMHTLNPRSGRRASESNLYGTSTAASHTERGSGVNHQLFQHFKHRGAGPNPAGGEGAQRLKNRLVTRGIPENVVGELLEQPTIISYTRGSFIFLQGAPTDLLFWVSSGLVDILCPGSDGEQIRANILGPGDFFGFVENKGDKGRPTQAYQARARTNVQIGLLIREHALRVLRRQDPTLLVHLLEEVIAAWSELTLRHIQFLGKAYNSRLEMILADLAMRFGVKESRGTLLVPEFGHNDFAEMIGSSRPMVSRLIAEMISAGRLAQNGKHYIVIDQSALTSEKRSSA
jgi:CRP-like cAMP-binding protein